MGGSPRYLQAFGAKLHFLKAVDSVRSSLPAVHRFEPNTGPAARIVLKDRYDMLAVAGALLRPSCPHPAASSRRATWPQSCSKARAGALDGANAASGNRRWPICSTSVA